MTDEQYFTVLGRVPSGRREQMDEAFRLGMMEAQKIAWEYARGLRTPSGTSLQQGDDIAAAIERAAGE